MGWKLWGSRTTEADRSLAALRRGETTSTPTLADYEDELFVSLTANPTARTPGSPLACLNEGGSVRVGDRVQLATSFTTQETRIVAMSRDGVPCSTLDFEERADVVLADDADLTDVYRTSILTDPGSAPAADEQLFLLQVHTAEQRGKDVQVAGKAQGTVEPGHEVVVSPFNDAPDKRFATVRAVDVLPDGRVGLTLAHRDASAFEHGDEVVRY
jgi:hypothetical protein